MAYLHEDREEFRNAVNLTSERFGILPVVAEKDYYVTMILRSLSNKLEYIVFKGGTSRKITIALLHEFLKKMSLMKLPLMP